MHRDKYTMGEDSGTEEVYAFVGGWVWTVLSKPPDTPCAISGTQTTTALPDGIIRSPSLKWQAFRACHANSMDAV